MPRTGGLVLIFGLLGGAAWAAGQAPAKQQDTAKQESAKQQAPANEQAPPEEDESLQVKQYSFNPLQAEKELKIGNFYFKKGSYKAAAGRFQEALKWNPTYADAYLRLGEADERLSDGKAAQKAYAKFVELAPKDKRADEVRKKLATFSAKK